MSEHENIPKYICHKTVHAFKIVAIIRGNTCMSERDPQLVSTRLHWIINKGHEDGVDRG